MSEISIRIYVRSLRHLHSKKYEKDGSPNPNPNLIFAHFLSHWSRRGALLQGVLSRNKEDCDVTKENHNKGTTLTLEVLPVYLGPQEQHKGPLHIIDSLGHFGSRGWHSKKHAVKLLKWQVPFLVYHNRSNWVYTIHAWLNRHQPHQTAKWYIWK